MGPRLTILAVAQVILFATGVAAADNRKAVARQLFELGIEEYKAKQYEAAAASMAKVYSLDPQPNALYALAQAERLAGNCKGALKHYKELLETSKDDKAIITAVKASIELCEQIERGEEAKLDPETDAKAVEQRDAPLLQIKTVYRTERKNDKLAIAMFAGGGTVLGGAVAMFIVARSTRSDADNATTLADYNAKYDSAARLRLLSYAAAGVGVTLVALATMRVVRGNRERPSEIAVLPLRGGSMIAWSSSW